MTNRYLTLVALDRAYEEGVGLLFARLFHRLAEEPEGAPEEAQAAFEKGLETLDRALDMAKESMTDA